MPWYDLLLAARVPRVVARAARHPAPALILATLDGTTVGTPVGTPRWAR